MKFGISTRTQTECSRGLDKKRHVGDNFMDNGGMAEPIVPL